MERILNEKAIELIGQKVKLAGWVENIRFHGKIIFLDLRDMSGIIQAVITPNSGQIYETAKKIRPEWVVEIEGEVSKRPEKMVNHDIKTGSIEIGAETLKVLSESKTLPFDIHNDNVEVNEEVRFKYRYLDLRRRKASENLKSRHRVLQFFRNRFQEKGFAEIETPILSKSTPEGARDFLVPSRLLPGNFYALPQSPQQYKQLLMVAGIERYFQIARCFRDEDSRANRQAEFTQIDIEASFMDQKDILNLVERMIIDMVADIFPEKEITEAPFPKITYGEAKEKHGSDCPDFRKDKNNKNELSFLWVTDFPMFTWSENEKRWDAEHHPFTRPKEKDPVKIKENPESVSAFQYDLVLNGQEIGGGSLRSYKPEILEVVFEVMGHKKKDIYAKFGHLLEAFCYGVPPHGGIAIGFDRFLSIILNEENIREVIAFPKTGDSKDSMMDSPSPIDPSQIKELGIKIDRGKNDSKKKS